MAAIGSSSHGRSKPRPRQIVFHVRRPVFRLRFTTDERAFAGVFGGGVKFALSPRQGVRAELRVSTAPSATAIRIDARPAAVTGSPAFSLSSFTTPSLVFSNTPAVRHNLSGAPIADLKTFTGSGRDVETSLTVGYFFRF